MVTVALFLIMVHNYVMAGGGRPLHFLANDFHFSKEDRAKALEKLLPHQKKDFIEIFKIMHGLPVTVRLLDPPLHEFLPKSNKEITTTEFSVLKESKNYEVNPRSHG